MSGGFTREVRFIPRRGNRRARIYFILRGPRGVITAMVDTGWKTPRLPADEPAGFGISSHCTEPLQDWWMHSETCDVLDGECWGDTGMLVSDKFVDLLLAGDDEGAWAYLAEIHDAWLAPDPAEVSR